MTKINEKVREWRKTNNYTLKQAGTVLGFSASYLCEIETGEKEFTTALIRSYLEADPNFFKADDFYQQTPH